AARPAGVGCAVEHKVKPRMGFAHYDDAVDFLGLGGAVVGFAEVKQDAREPLELGGHPRRSGSTRTAWRTRRTGRTRKARRSGRDGAGRALGSRGTGRAGRTRWAGWADDPEVRIVAPLLSPVGEAPGLGTTRGHEQRNHPSDG